MQVYMGTGLYTTRTELQDELECMGTALKHSLHKLARKHRRVNFSH
jgi:hypothetical protein